MDSECLIYIALMAACTAGAISSYILYTILETNWRKSLNWLVVISAWLPVISGAASIIFAIQAVISFVVSVIFS